MLRPDAAHARLSHPSCNEGANALPVDFTAQAISRCSDHPGSTAPDALVTVFGSRSYHHCKSLSPKSFGGKGKQGLAIFPGCSQPRDLSWLARFLPRSSQKGCQVRVYHHAPLVPFPNDVPSSRTTARTYSTRHGVQPHRRRPA